MSEINEFMNKCIVGDCLSILKEMPDESVNMCVTSPPYWGLRDYGVNEPMLIGLEPTPEQYISNLVNVFSEVKRVLKHDGTLWLNLGDTYSKTMSNNGGHSDKSTLRGYTGEENKYRKANDSGVRVKLDSGVPSKNLLGMPWRVAFALQNIGFILRADIIWNKPNKMPESVKDRPVRSHEYVFLFAKNKDYYYNADAIKEPLSAKSNDIFSSGRTRRTVWNINTTPYKGAHFAVFPNELAEIPIKAACPIGGVVLDPFGGAGTVAAVSKALGRNFISIDLNPFYVDMQNERLKNEV